MPRSSSGKWVARAAATGGGRTYRGQMPVNWYAVLVLLVVLGIASVVISRVDYRHGPTVNTIAPLKGVTPWFAAIDFDVCGKEVTPLASNVVDPTKQSFYTTGDGVIAITPKKTSDAGHNAVLGKFVSAYTGLTLTSTELHLPAPAPPTPTTTTTTTTSPSAASSTTSTTTTTSPSAASSTTSTTSASGKKARSSSGTTYRNGETCPAGTPDARKKADVTVTYWKNAFAAKGKPVTLQGDPATLLFTDNQLITVGFVPPGTKLHKPSSKIRAALYDISTGTSSTTTTTAPSSSTTTTTSPGSSSTTSTSGPGSSSTTTTTGSTSSTTTSTTG
jgi:hypothetical protein